jgi:hypothetical protein
MLQIILIGLSVFILLLIFGIVITSHDEDEDNPTTL